MPQNHSSLSGAYCKEVRLHLQPILRIREAALEDTTTVVRGELLGLESDDGLIEVTNCFTCVNIGARGKMRDLYDSIDADPQAVGIWTKGRSSDMIDATISTITTMDISPNVLDHLVEDLHTRCQTVDPHTVLVTFDVELHKRGRFPFKAYRLSCEWQLLRRKLDRSEIDAAAYRKFMANIGSPLASIACSAFLTPYDYAISTICFPPISAKISREKSVQKALTETRDRELLEINIAVEEATVR